MSVFVGDIEALRRLPELRERLSGTITTTGVLRGAIPAPSLSRVSVSLSFPGVKGHSRFLSGMVARDTIDLSGALVHVSKLVKRLRERGSPVTTSPREVPTVPLSLSRLSAVKIRMKGCMYRDSSSDCALPARNGYFVRNSLALSGVRLGPMAGRISVMS